MTLMAYGSWWMVSGDLDALPIKGGGIALAVNLERPFLADRIGTNENPVLPGRQTSEHTSFHRFIDAKTQICFHAGQRIGREPSPLFGGEPYFVVPIDIVWGRRHQPQLA